MPTLKVDQNTSSEAFKAFAQQVENDHHVLASEIRDKNGLVVGFKLYTDKQQNLQDHQPQQLQNKYKNARHAVNIMLRSSGRQQRQLSVNNRAVHGQMLKEAVHQDFAAKRRYDPNRVDQNVRDEILRDSTSRNVKERLKHLSAKKRLTRTDDRRRKFWDWKLGVESKGKSSLGKPQTAVGSRLQQVRAHKNRRVLLRELSELTRAPLSHLEPHEQARQHQVLRELSLALTAQKNQLKALKAVRPLDNAEKDFEERLDSATRRLAKVQRKFERGNERPLSIADIRKFQRLFATEPNSVKVLSADRHFASAAKVKDPQFEARYRQASIGDLLRTASDHQIGVDGAQPEDFVRRGNLVVKYKSKLHSNEPIFEDLQEKHQQMLSELNSLNQGIALSKPEEEEDPSMMALVKDYKKGLERRRDELQPEVDQLTNELQNLQNTEVRSSYHRLLKTAEQRGLLADLERKAGAGPATGAQIQFRRADGTTLNIHADQIHHALDEFRQEHTQVAKEMATGRWARFKRWVSRKFDWVRGFGTTTKAGSGGIESELGNVDEHGGPRVETERKDLEMAGHVVDIAEHVAGIGVAVKGIMDKQAAIDAKRNKQKAGANMVQQYNNSVDNCPEASRAALRIRSGVANHFGHKLQDQEIGLDKAEQRLMKLHVLRHAAQGSAQVMSAVGKGAGVAAKLAGGGVIGAAVAETGEALIAIYETGKGVLEKRDLDKVAEKQGQQIADKYEKFLRGDQNVNVRSVKVRLTELKEEVRQARSDLDFMKHGGVDPEDADLVKSMEKNLRAKTSLVSEMEEDLGKLRVTESLLEMMKDRKNVGRKALIATQKTFAVGGYSLGVMATFGVGGTLMLTLGPIGVGLATGTAFGLLGYKNGKDDFRQWKASRSADAIIGRADPGVVDRLKEQAEEQGITPQQVAFNHIARQDPRYMAARHLYKLKQETQLVRWTNQELARMGHRGPSAEMQVDHEEAILQSSPTARFLHQSLKMPVEAIASIVDAANNDHHDEIGRKMIEEYLEED